LSPRFSAAAANFASGLSGLGALTAIGKEVDNRGVHGNRVGLYAENGFGERNLADDLAGHV
jgi:hypothetical protein